MRLASALVLLWASSASWAQDTRAAYLQQFDGDGDGQVSATEYVAYMSRGFQHMDRNGDGSIDRNELPGGRGQPITAQENRDNLRRQFHRLDRNRDDYLNARELTAPPR